MFSELIWFWYPSMRCRFCSPEWNRQYTFLGRWLRTALGWAALCYQQYGNCDTRSISSPCRPAERPWTRRTPWCRTLRGSKAFCSRQDGSVTATVRRYRRSIGSCSHWCCNQLARNHEAERVKRRDDFNARKSDPIPSRRRKTMRELLNFYS